MLSGGKVAVYSLEDSIWTAARVIWSPYSMYSHMCQDAAEAEMRAIERITIKEVMGWN